MPPNVEINEDWDLSVSLTKFLEYEVATITFVENDLWVKIEPKKMSQKECGLV